MCPSPSSRDAHTHTHTHTRPRPLPPPKKTRHKHNKFYTAGLSQANESRWDTTWLDVYQRAYPAELGALKWYGLLGNHDYSYTVSNDKEREREREREERRACSGVRGARGCLDAPWTGFSEKTLALCLSKK